MSNDPTVYVSPAEKKASKIIKYALLGGTVLGGAFAIKMFVPTLTDAVILLQKLTANTTMLVIDVAVLGAVLVAINDLVSKNGITHKLLGMIISSASHAATDALLENDPLSPLKDSLAETKKDKAYYDENFAQFDGAIQNFRQGAQERRDAAAKAEKRAKVAQQEGNAQAFKDQSYAYGSNNDAANQLDGMADKLEPVRKILVQLQQETASLIFQLGTDLENAEITWNAANKASNMEGAARKILSSHGQSELAQEAQKKIQAKYATTLGRLRNLKELAQPMLDSTNLDKAAYSQDLLDKWQAEANRPAGMPQIQATVLTPAPAMSDFSKLIDN